MDEIIWGESFAKIGRKVFKCHTKLSLYLEVYIVENEPSRSKIFVGWKIECDKINLST